MISFIVCSRKKHLDTKLVANIASVVSVPYEIIVIDNSKNAYSIFSAYNSGVERAQYPYLAFIHEDILFHSNNVGHIIVNSFAENPKLGLLGVAGITILPQYAFGWWSAGYDYYVGGVAHKGCPHTPIVLKDAVACDGLFLCIRAELFRAIRWDEHTFKGFHCYDMDICMQILKAGYKIMVAEGLLIEHFSTGNPTESFAEGCVLFSKKWNKELPVSIDCLPKNEVLMVQERVISEYLVSYPLAIRYKHLCQNPMGGVLLKAIKKLKKIR